ncbi:toxin-antitoxin system YwqK family antitoxin [Algoriphagus sp.]|uniref:toxin-antitoxin system YwqK family antitoxin n=1 Tax=Algoriphagus sp. TaxID=1872435 RepID=UPI0025CD083E|nr:toxin-antitoxin system YwqK family antitoxin [Algoriphagus sp.]
MTAIIFSVLIHLFVNNLNEQAYFYFGNDNLVGVGNLKEGEKSGEWKVFYKINPENSPDPNFEKVDPEFFDKNFNKEIPIYVISFSEDIPEGVFQENYPSGAVKTLAIFENGELENEFKEFFENGDKKSTGQFEAGKRSGEWQEYYESGQLKSSISFVDGMEEGEAIYYTPEGVIEMKFSNSKGKWNGLYQAFFPNGELKEKGIFKDGIRSGEWFEQLNVMPEYFRKGNYLKDLKEGEWTVIDMEGKHLQTENYQAGKLISVIEIQNAENLKDQYLVKKGKGQRIFYDDQGFIKAKGKISKGKINGKWVFYFPNSNRITSSGRFIGTERVGKWNFYSYEGEIIDQIQYKASPKPAVSGDSAGFSRTYQNNNQGKDSLGSALGRFTIFSPNTPGWN